MGRTLLEIHQWFKRLKMQVGTIFISSVGSTLHFMLLLDLKKATVRRLRGFKRKKMIQKICGTYPFIMPRFTIKVNAIEGHRLKAAQNRFASSSQVNFSHYIRVRKIRQDKNRFWDFSRASVGLELTKQKIQIHLTKFLNQQLLTQCINKFVTQESEMPKFGNLILLCSLRKWPTKLKHFLLVYQSYECPLKFAWVIIPQGYFMNTYFNESIWLARYLFRPSYSYILFNNPWGQIFKEI